jgi:hypothetical protein
VITQESPQSQNFIEIFNMKNKISIQICTKLQPSFLHKK